MPTLPWTVPNRPPQATEVHVFASRFETRTLWGALKFLVRTPGVWRQIRSAPGAYGASLRAEPFRRTFWTLSAWESPQALKTFARSGAHAPASRGLSAQMRESTFASWQASSDELPVNWAEVRSRLT
ncbi:MULTISPECIES: hypothetical protein [Streptomyces]|uniref:DUF3291 domain-containing protein n=1 Tax=Streptomyces olivaceus TaxID=47716 RepID=A0ABS7VX84_STROV|nr:MULTISPECIES: hypothetical protein [Streptomyces]MBZ6086949.1 DUF3291 domain-containing protein [Streptomyces olivaceus]MBZ6094450.1 DUF3291 domain-containing protein [Streptomyces olivaceus]MBZ6108300.1 DUF3291 domain-containing protein [Streptomyces olivaceus]MBZ6115566.1 DUF3291 domain-containing protein [Streptomyces olivaceus]MBZ6122184.1 DUF3291 domain-containing protein [Streptomyces olivaceus]